MSRKITIDEDEYILFRQWMFKKIKETRSQETIDTLDYFTHIVDRGKAKSKFRVFMDEWACGFGYLMAVYTIVRLILCFIK